KYGRDFLLFLVARRNRQLHFLAGRVLLVVWFDVENELLTGRMIDQPLGTGDQPLAVGVALPLFEHGHAVNAASRASRPQFDAGSLTLLGRDGFMIHKPAAAVGADEQRAILFRTVNRGLDGVLGLAPAAGDRQYYAIFVGLGQIVLPFDAGRR